MRKVYVFLYVFLSILLCSFVFAVEIPDTECTNDPTLHGLWHGNDDLTDACGNNNLVAYGTTAYRAGLYGNSFDDQSNTPGSYFNTTAEDETWVLGDGSGNRTISFWIYPDDAIFSPELIPVANFNNTGDRWIITGDSANSFNLIIDCDTDYTIAVGRGMHDQQWSLITIVFNDDNNTYSLWENSTELGTKVAPCTDVGSADGMRWGDDGAAADRGHDGGFDDIAIWNRTLTPDQIISLSLGNYSTKAAELPSEIDAPVVTLLTPTNNTYDNALIQNFSYSVNCTDCITDSCSLFFNDTLTSTDDIVGNDTVEWFNGEVLTDGEWLWQVNCTDNNTNTSFSAANYTLVIDTINPIITPDETSRNKTVIYDIFSGQINSSDVNLYSVMVTFDGVVLNNATDNVTSLDVTSHLFNWSYNFSTNITGLHNMSYRVCDGHTAQTLLGDYKISDGLFNNKLEFDIDNKNSIKIAAKGGSILDSMTAKREEDRYTFDYEPYDIKKENYTFTVESDEYIDIIIKEETKWKKWLITGESWIDFYIDGTEVISFNRISESEVEVTVSNLKDKEVLRFKSIGELNCVENIYSWYKYNYSTGHTSSIVENTKDNFTFNISSDTNFVNDMSAILTYNGTEYSPTKATIISGTSKKYLFYKELPAANLTIDKNISLHWNYTIIGNETLKNMTANLTQEVIGIGFDDCSSYATPVLNFSLLSESNREFVFANVEYTIEIIYAGLVINISDGIDTVTNFSICMSTANGNYTTDILVQYTPSGKDTRDWIKKNYTIDNVVDLVDLFSLNSTVSSAVTIHVKDENEDDIVNVQIEADKYYIENNTYETVSIESTDTGGDSGFNLEVGSTYYRFKFYQEGELKLTSDTFKITETALEYTISATAGNHPIINWLRVQSISGDIVYTNSSNTFVFTYNDTNNYADEVCLEVNDGQTSFFSNCNTSAASSMTYEVTTFNTTYTAIATASVGDSDYTISSLSINLRDFWRHLGGVNESIMYAMIIFLIITLVALTSPQVAVGAGVFALIGLYALGMIPAGMSAIIGIGFVGVIMVLLMRERYYQ